MAGKVNLSSLYTRLMDFHDYGKALYQVTSDEVSPGKVGYFDKKGNWNLVVDLDNKEELRKMKYSEVEIIDDLRMEDTTTSGIIFGPKYSKTVKESELQTSGAVDLSNVVPAAEFTVTATCKFSTENDEGAILLSSKPVTRTRRHDDAIQVYMSWIEENEAKLLKNHGIRKNGLWVVLSTYTSTDCSWKVWAQAQTEFTLAFETALQKAGGIELSGRWKDTSQVGGWTSTPRGRTSVIFMDGMRFSKGSSKFTMRSLASCFKNVRKKHLKYTNGDDEDLSDSGE